MQDASLWKRGGGGGVGRFFQATKMGLTISLQAPVSLTLSPVAFENRSHYKLTKPNKRLRET